MGPQQIKIVILWLIRQYQPISFQQLREFIVAKDERLPGFLHDPRLFRMMYGGINYVEELVKAGLVKTENNEPLALDSRLVTTPALGLIQDMFAISLMEQLQRTEESITTTPFFGKPQTKVQNGVWSDVFVAMPFQNDLRPIYTNHIRKVADELGVSCKRGDDFFSGNSIIHEVWSAIYHARLCIVDCTGRNPNVFYELGIAHTLGRKAVLIAQTIDDIPFDVRHLRVITYTLTAPGMQKFEDDLRKTLRAELGL